MHGTVAFTIATSLTRLTSGPKNVFVGLSAGQQLQRINECLERLWVFGTWRGLFETASGLTTTAGVLTLSSAYLKLEALNDSTTGYKGCDVPIKTMQWAFSPSGYGVRDWTQVCGMYAIDMGDVGGVRKYQLTGVTATLDAKTFIGLVRKRYTWATDTATTVYPDSFQALKLCVQALGYEDEGATSEYKEKFAEALQALESDISEATAEQSWGAVSIDPAISMAGMNLV